MTENRVLVLAPFGRDAAVIVQALAGAGIDAHECPDMDALCAATGRGAAAVLVAEEALGEAERRRLETALVRQPAWSDLPLLVMLSRHTEASEVWRALGAIEGAAHLALLERPLHVATFVSAVRSALQSRRRQYQVRDELRARARAERQLREANRRKDEFLAALGHELRNPLAPLRNTLAIIKQDPVEPDVLQQARRTMDRQLGHMVRLVDDLLDVGRISRGKIRLRTEQVELCASVRHAVEDVRPRCEAKGQKLEVSLPERPVFVSADPVRLTQIVGNLLDNAWKFTGPGGSIRLHVAPTNGDAEIRVRDTGIGIAPSKLRRVFEMFSQIDARASGRGGLGIGLALAKSLVKLHGGSIEAHSEGRGRGAEVVVRLPAQAAPEERPEPAARRPERAPAAASRRVLVVDDNRDAAETLGDLLGLQGHEAHTAFDGAQAIAAANELRPEVIVLDIGLPDIDGYEVARRIREQPWGESVLLVALTGWGQPRDRERSRQAGFDAHLVKPLDHAELTPLLEAARERTAGG